MRRASILLALAWLSACGGNSTVTPMPDAGPVFCQHVAAQCSFLGDCTMAMGNCDPDQQMAVESCLPSNVGGACNTNDILDCYLAAGCIFGATPPVCGDGFCNGGETSATCLADCPAPTCSHDECTSGDALGEACTACTTMVCAADSYCCVTAWDSNCITSAQNLCGLCP